MVEIKKSFLDNVSVTKKSFILLLITTVGMMFLGALEYIGLYNINQKVQTLYTRDVQCITHLYNLDNVYNGELQAYLQEFQYQKSDVTHTILNLQESAVHASKAWNILKENDTKSANYIEEEISSLTIQFQNAIKTLEKSDIDSFLHHELPLFQSLILTLNQKSAALINRHNALIDQEKKSISQHYYATLSTTTLFIFLLLLASIVLAYSIYKSIQKLIFGLSDIVTRKTKDYQELALQLEYKVNKEVIKNREKDQIMYQHARLAAMGEMIGNIAHQWRQPLNALTLLIQSFGTKSMTGNLSQEFIDKQVSEGLRLANQMSNTIEDFKNFFSPHKDREYFGVVKSLNDTLELVEFFCKDEHIDIRLIAKEEVRIYGYANEFSQVILNLLNNARDNFKQKNIQKERKIIIKVEKKVKPEPFVMISFVDNGGGIDPNIIDRIFEPYFTTKHKSTGTGIGLYMSKQIIEKQMHGLVTMKNITSKLGTAQTYQCAQFIIAIPLK